MTEEDARNFEIIKLFAPAAIPFIFTTSFTAILFRTIETQEKSTKESIAVTKEQIVASDKSTKELIAVIDKSNKDAIMATNNLIMSNKNDAQRQIDAFEEKFNHFYNDVRSNMKNN